MTEDAIKYAEAQLMCATVCEIYGLSPEATALALDAAAERFRGAWSCYRAILNSLTWEPKC